MTASHTTTDDARIPDHCGWAARGYWREAYDDAVAALRQVTAERDFMHSCGVIELMIRNPNVDSYVKEWEARAETAETEVARLIEAISMTADEAMQVEIPGGYLPPASPEFHRGYDAAIDRARAALNGGKTDD